VTHLLDTDHLSVWQWDTMPDTAMMKLHLDGLRDGDVGVSVVSYHEQSNGCHARLNRAKTPQDLIDGYELFVKVLKSLQKFPVVPFDTAGIELTKLQALKLGVRPMDLRIAAIARSRNLTVVTRNVSDFAKVPNLKIED
jgi:tRNA(fMet)-specific endonuclease VapC